MKQICFFQEEQKYSKSYKIKSIFLAASRTWKKQRNWSTSCFESNQYFKSVCLILRQVKYILIYHLVLLSRALKLSLELRNRVWFFGAYYLLFFLLIWHSLASNGLYCSFYLHIIYQKLSYVANCVGFLELYWPFGCLRTPFCLNFSEITYLLAIKRKNLSFSILIIHLHFCFFRANSGSGGENNSRTIGGGNRSFMPMRSASMRETSHSRSIRRYWTSSILDCVAALQPL